MTEKRKPDYHVLLICFIMLLPWFSYILFMLSGMNVGDKNALGYIFPEQLIALVPAAVMIAITLFLNHLFKPDLSAYFKIHMSIRLVTNLICIMLLTGFVVLSNSSGGSLGSILILLIFLYWFVPIISMLMEIGLLISQRVYQQPKEFAVLLVSNAGAALLLTLIFELFILGSHL